MCGGGEEGVRMRACACVRACERACVRACVRVCVLFVCCFLHVYTLVKRNKRKDS